MSDKYICDCCNKQKCLTNSPPTEIDAYEQACYECLPSIKFELELQGFTKFDYEWSN
tara:strand:- start:1104 stop:1274 length:171 start_codon:yes stop_codon:yes gene_type:complete